MRSTVLLALLLACPDTPEDSGDTDTHTDEDSDTAVDSDTDVEVPSIVADDAARTDEETPLALDVLANDPGEGLTIVAYDTSGTVGSVLLRGDEKFAWIPAAGANALGGDDVVVDTFRYTAQDASGATAEATVTVTVQGQNDWPTVEGEVLATNENVTLRIVVLENDSDPDAGDLLTVSHLDLTGTVATVTLNESDNTILYDPTVAYDYLGLAERGEDSFKYTVSDGHGGEGTATVQVTVVGSAE